MVEELDFQQAVEQLREMAGDEANGVSDEEVVIKAMQSCVSLAKQCLQEQRNEWQVADLARVCLDYGHLLVEYGLELNAVQHTMGQMAELIYYHPRLELSLLHLRREALCEIEQEQVHPIGLIRDIEEEISVLRRNIEYADKGEFDKIVNDGHFKRDPIEWTARWEEVIDQADEIAYSRLADTPRGMGFCHAIWHERAKVLREEFGIEWRSPQMMNPRVLFD